jgi:AraC family transcriptional regulator of adaptative response / DNA-3-methyladenine glycosylase II
MYGKKAGTISISNDAKNSRLLLEINFPDLKYYKSIFNRVSKMFDINHQPLELKNIIKSKDIKKIYSKHAGIRLTSGWDSFEISIATILGQLVSVERGKSLLNDLIELVGKSASLKYNGNIIKKFPTPKAIVAADLTSLKTTRIRKKTLVAFSQAMIDKKINFDTYQSLDEFQKDVLEIYGIGKWTANYIALKGLSFQDAFPDTDLVLARAIKLFPIGIFDSLKPLRGYIAMLLWREYAAQLSKKVSKK